MLVKCPKCGFDQPKDTYCANCGIEMDSYKPVKAPFWKRMVKSPWFSLMIFLALGYASVLYLKNPSQFGSPTANSHITGFNHDLKTANGSVPPQSDLAGVTSPTPSPTAIHAENQPTPEHPVVAAESPVAPVAKPESPSAVMEATSGAGSKTETPELRETEVNEPTETTEKTAVNIEAIKGPLVLEVRFVEAPMELVHRFQAEASQDAGGDSGEMSYAIVKNASKWLSNRSLVELDQLTKKVPAVKQKLQWFSGTQEPSTGAPFGLNFQVSIQERNGGHLEGDLFISRSLVEQSPEGPMTQRKEFMTRFETDVGSLIGLSGVMPHTAVNLKNEDKDWLQNSLLKVFLSPAYLQNETELLILFQFKGDSR